MAKTTLTINGITKPYDQWAGLINPLTGEVCKKTTIQDCLRRRRRGEFLTDIQCLWGKTNAPEESQLLQESTGSFTAFMADIERAFVKHFGQMAKIAPQTTKKKPNIIYNTFWSKKPNQNVVDEIDFLSDEELHNLSLRPDEIHFFCLNSADLTTLHTLSKHYFEGGYEYIYDTLQSRAIIKHFNLKDPKSFKTWNTLLSTLTLCQDPTVMTLNKGKLITLAQELGLNPAILPTIDCSPRDFPSPEQLEWWDILGDNLSLYPVTTTDLIN